MFLSNTGPGDPAPPITSSRYPRVLGAGIPLFGICFGNQILGRALGGLSTYKMWCLGTAASNIRSRRPRHRSGGGDRRPSGRQANPFATPFGPAVVGPHLRQRRVWSKGVKLVDGRTFSSARHHPEAAAGPHDASTCSTSSWRLMAGGPLNCPSLFPICTAAPLVIGSGPVVIGQACEFDYSGTQACRVLRAGLAGQPWWASGHHR